MDRRITDYRDVVTVYSHRDMEWIFPQRIRAVGSISLPGGGVLEGILLDNATHHGPGTLIARVTMPLMWVSVNGSNWKIVDRLFSALLIEKYGFSVVAPIKVINPRSTSVSRTSC